MNGDVPQKDRKESVWTLARRVSRNVRNALVRSLTEDMAREKGELQQWRSLWLTVPQWRAAATLLPMPLLMQLLIYAWLHEMAPPPVFSASGSKQGGGEQRGARPAPARLVSRPPVLLNRHNRQLQPTPMSERKYQHPSLLNTLIMETMTVLPPTS